MGAVKTPEKEVVDPKFGSVYDPNSETEPPADEDRTSLACRRRRFQIFLSLIEDLPRPIRILDVGGTEQFWRSMEFPGDRDGVWLTLLNLEREPVDDPRFISLAGNACDLSAYSDQSYDIVFSNSVIEHVGGADDQRAMADEIRRVGRRYFVQTPNFFFPVEPHFMIPGFQFLPRSMRCFLLTRFSLGAYGKVEDKSHAKNLVDEIQLLTGRRFKNLFPDAKIHRERWMGMTKSLIAVRG